MLSNSAGRWFFVAYAGAMLIGIAVLLVIDKGEAVVWCTEHRTAGANILFKNLTLLGDGWFLGIFCLVAALVRYKYSLILTTIGIGQLLVTYVLKRKIFGNMPRPQRFFDPSEYPAAWQIEGVDVHSNYAFPSGHTITAFGLALFVALMSGKRWVGFAMALLAVLVGFSRVYLFQHFLVDVVVGSCVGVMITATVFRLASRSEAFWENQRLDRSPLGIDWR